MTRTVFLLLAACVCFSGSLPDEKTPAITISAVPLSVRHNRRIHCWEFQIDDSRLIRVLQAHEAAKFMAELPKLKRQKEGYGIDTHAKIVIKYEHRTDTLCADRFTISVNGTYRKMSGKLRRFIWR